MSALSPRAQDYYKKVKELICKEIIPREKEFYDFAVNPDNKWKIHPVLEELKVKYLIIVYALLSSTSSSICKKAKNKGIFKLNVYVWIAISECCH